MKIRKPMLYCAAFIVCMTLLVACGKGEQSAADTFFDTIETSANESKARVKAAHADDETETSQEDGKSVEDNLQNVFTHTADHGRIENKNQSIEMSLKEIQARKQPAAAVERALSDQTAAGSETVSVAPSGELSSASSSTEIGTSSNTPSDQSSNSAPSSTPSGETSSATSTVSTKGIK